LKVNVLGTDYTIIYKTHEEEPVFKEKGWDGFCDEILKEIIILDLDKTEEWQKITPAGREAIKKRYLRHEITHAFLSESGLSDDSNSFGNGWATNEEMVDWIAIQFPKMLKAFQETDCI
jgi:hypothetical protein